MKWWLFPALATALCLTYFFLPESALSNSVYFGIAVVSALAIVAGIRINRPSSAGAWYLIAAGVGLWVLGDAAFLAIYLDQSVVPILSAADIVYLTGYPVLAAGLYTLVHQSWRRGELGHVANSTIVMIAFGLLMWVFVVQPASADVSTVEGLVGVAYPAMDVFLLGLLIHFVGATQWESTAFRLLTASVVAVLIADIAADVEPVEFVTTGPHVIDAGYLAGYVLVGTAALHPSMSALGAHPSRRRPSTLISSFNTTTVVAVTAATLTVPLAMGILIARGEPVTEWGWGVVLCATLLIGLVFVRVTDLLRLLDRQTQTLRGYAESDPLTGLPNRRGLEAWVDQLPDEDGPIAFLMVDIDRFEDINDTFGYALGDDVLRAVGDRLTRAVGDRGVVGRIGADEFAVVVTAHRPETTRVADDMFAALKQALTVGHATLLVEVSIGVACSSDSHPPLFGEELGRHAYFAMEAAKTLPSRYAHYDSSMERDDTSRLLLLGELTSAIEHRQLEIFYQVQVDLTTMKAVGVEALLRWNHPELGLVEPDSFMPMAERTGLIRPLLDYVLRDALTQQKSWAAQGVELTVSVNISTRNLLDTTLVDCVARTLDTVGVDPRQLSIEITETASMTDPSLAVETLLALRALGVGLAIDDYGTGYSSLTYLQRLPVQQLKIDKAFVTDMTSVLAHRVIVRSTIDLARALGLSITAEGVEDRETLLELKQLCCHYAQGYHLGRPMPAQDIPESVNKLDAELSEYTEVT
ncbi:MAG: bifunctional diguanylate cyclase/phosphodiesterase [Rhodococcus sp. (in: high G+C Gram-positive bacteria)]